MNKKLLTLIGLLGASAVASMCVIPHVNYNEDVAKTNISSIRNNINSRTIHNPLEIAYEEFGKIGSSYEMPYSEVGVFKKGTSFNVGDVIIAHGQGFSLTDVRSSFQELGFSSGMGVADVEELKSAILDKYPGDSAIEEDIDDLADEQTFEYYYYCKKACTVSVEPDYPTSYYKVPSSTVDNHIKDIQAPSIDGTNNFVVNVNNMLSKEEILSHITAVDDTDGKVDVVIDSTDYDPASRKVGDYTMNVSASDKAGNKTTAVITIKVVDIDKPVISGTSSYTVEYDAPVSLDTIKGALTVSDNYDTGLELQVIQDDYTGHEREVGAHTITFKAVDSSKNESDVYTVTVNVQDTKKPVISAPGKITVSTNALLTLEELKAKISITDGLDGPITEYEIVGYENYQANYKTVGNYTITINVKDANNNPATATIIITTEDKIAPEIWFDDYFIILGLGEQLTDEQIREYASKVLGISVESIAEVSGEWNTNELGTYRVSVKTVSGEAYSFRLFVDEQPYQEVVELDWWDRIWKGLSVALGIEDGYRADGFIDWFTDIPERFSLCWDIWTTGSYIKRTGSLSESSKTQQELYQENVISEVAFKNKMLIEEYEIEF